MVGLAVPKRLIGTLALLHGRARTDCEHAQILRSSPSNRLRQAAGIRANIVREPLFAALKKSTPHPLRRCWPLAFGHCFTLVKV